MGTAVKRAALTPLQDWHGELLAAAEARETLLGAQTCRPRPVRSLMFELLHSFGSLRWLQHDKSNFTKLCCSAGEGLSQEG